MIINERRALLHLSLNEINCKLVKLAILVTALLCLGPVAVTAQSDSQTNLNTFVQIDTFIPKEVPVILDNSHLWRTIDGDFVLTFNATNTTTERFSSLQLLAMVVDQNGGVKFGQGLKSKAALESLSSLGIEATIKHLISNGDRLVLVAYEAAGETNAYKVAPALVMDAIASKGLIKTSSQYIKSRGAKVADENPCSAAQSAATAACKCGLKSFSCNPETGAYSFTCFSRQENPSACPEGPPEN